MGACLCLNYMFACVSMSSHTSARGRWEGGQGQAEASVRLGCFVIKLAIPPGATIREASLSPSGVS